MFWCDYCKVWMNDNPATKATHEAGMKHKDNVARSKPLILVLHNFKMLPLGLLVSSVKSSVPSRMLLEDVSLIHACISAQDVM